LELEQLLELVGPARGRRVQIRGGTRLAQLFLQLRVLVLRVREAVEVAVDVAERTGDALCGELERLQRGSSVALGVVEDAGRRRAEGDRQEGERADDEHREDDAAEQRVAAPRGVPVGSGAPDRRAQHRHARGAVAGWHGRRLTPIPGDGGPAAGPAGPIDARENGSGLRESRPPRYRRPLRERAFERRDWFERWIASNSSRLRPEP